MAIEIERDINGRRSLTLWRERQWALRLWLTWRWQIYRTQRIGPVFFGVGPLRGMWWRDAR